MNCHFLSLKILSCYVGLIIGVLAPFYSPDVNAEKYFTWVDEKGRVHHTVIPEDNNPLIKPESADDKGSISNYNEKAHTGASDEGNENTDKSLTSVSEFDRPEAALIEKGPVSDIPAVSSVVISAPVDEKQLDLSDVPEARQVEINEDDYIDGDVLLQQGNIRDKNDLPYYTWTDEQGIVRNTPYQPKASTVKPKDAETKAKKEKIESIYSVYEEYRWTDHSRGGLKGRPQKIDSFAQKLFFDGQADNFIHSFARSCCAELPKESPSVLDFEDSVYIEVDKSADSFLFSEGKSPFALVELPVVQENYSLKLKTFVKTSGKTGVKNGVFFPQIVFLDEKFKVLRIVRNPILEYVPENWRRHGYLIGMFEVDGRENERYLLINTTKESLKARNRIENKTVVLLSNQKTGSFEIEALKN